MASVMSRAFAIAAAFALLFLALPHASAARSELTPAGEEGLAQIATCLRSNPNLVALLVIDESGSLQDTDPDNRRADILADFVLSLASLSGQETPQGPRVVEFAANTFAVDSQQLVPWTTLTDTNAQDISQQLRSEVPSRNQGQGTNYEAAIKGARSAVSEGVSRMSVSTPPCKIVVWFTDGVLSVGSDADNEASAQQLCAANGPINGLRKDGIHLLSVLLFDRGTLDQFDEPSQETLKNGIGLLQATAEGTGGSGSNEQSCGQVPVPADYAKGAFFEGNLDALAGQFAQAIALGSGGTPVPGLEGSPVAFEIEPGFTSFWVTAQAPNGFDLKSPAGDSLIGDPGSSGAQIAGSAAVVTWSGQTFTAKIPVTESSYGQWVLTRQGMSDPVDVYLFSDYSLEVDPVELIADKPATISGRVLSASGAPADLSSFSQADLTVTQVVDGQVVDPVPFELDRSTGTFTGSFTPATTSSQVVFDLTLNLTTASGFSLAPLTVSFVQDVKLPGGYPTLSPTSLILGSIQDRGQVASTVLQVQGSPDGPTQVCVSGTQPESEVSGAAVTFAVSPADGCIDIPQSGSASIDVSATLGSAVADGGEASGTLTLTLVNAPTSELPQPEPRELTVPVSVQVLPVGPVLWVPFVLTALGVIVPLAILYLINSLAARLRLDGLMMARIPIDIDLTDGARLRRSDGSSGALLTYDDLAFAPCPNRTKSWSPGLERLRAKAPINPFGAVTARVESPSTHVVVSDQPPNSTSSGEWAGVGLCPSMSSYLLVSREDLAAANFGERVKGELVAYLIPEDLKRDAQHLNTQILGFAAWGELLSAFKSHATKSGSAKPVAVPTSQSPTDGDAALPEPKRGRFDVDVPPSSTGQAPPAQSPKPQSPPDDPPPASPSGNRFSL